MIKISRRAMLAGSAATLAALTVSRAWAVEGKPGGSLVHLVPSEPPTFDFHATQTSYVPQTVGPCYSTLLRVDPATFPNVVGDLAESWEMSDDMLVYTFKLHDGVTFHDGTPFTAEDIKASYERIMNPPEGVVSVRKSELADIASIEIVDPLTVRFTLSEVNVAMLDNFSNPWHVIYSAKKLAENPNYPATELMGTGPFQYVEYEKGSHVALKRFDNYFVAGKPYLNDIRANFVGGPALTTALSAGQADAMFAFVSPQQIDAIKQVQGDEMVFDEAGMNSIVFNTFNTTKAPFDDVRVRQALNLAVNRQEADAALSRISVLKGATAFFIPGSQYVSTPEELETMPGYSSDIEASREKARQLLAEAGVPNLKVKLTARNLPPFEPPAVFFIDQWRQIGVEVEVVKLDTPQYFAALESKDFEVAVEGYNFNTMDPNNVFQKFLPGSSINYAGNTDDELVSLFEAMKKETDPAKRREMSQQYQVRLLDQAYYAPLLWNRRITVRRKSVMGWNNTPVFAVGSNLVDIWIDA